ncbi:MAG TPA: polyphosphate kinase 1 [Casimicrobiaceae bacterium]
MNAPDIVPLNRELSQLAFNRRVLAMAEDTEVPLLERLRFLCILAGNLDEFFEVRVAGLKEQIREKTPPPGLTLTQAQHLLRQVGDEVRALIADQYRVLNDAVLPALAAAGIRLIRRTAFTSAQRAWAAGFFAREVRPLLTPIGLDPAHPFPQVASKSLNFIVELGGRDAFGRDTAIAIVKAPRVLPRVIRMPAGVGGGAHAFVMLSSVIHAHLSELFPGREVRSYAQFRVTRDADLWIDEQEVKNLRQALRGELRQRQFGSAVRLEVPDGCPQPLARLLLAQFDLAEADLYRCDGPVNLARLGSLVDQVHVEPLKYAPFAPGLPDRLRAAPDLLGAIRAGDILLHHPYQSFEPVVDFIRRAAQDPDVVAVKQTIYRTGVNSVLMEALLDAARRGKEVSVVVELLARFDEEANIDWAERLESAGAQVVYGVFGFKTHAKLALLTRREPDGHGRMRLVQYAHLSTGNYHLRTTRQYTDFGLLTADPDICSDVNEIFLHITSLAKARRLSRLLLAPFTMHRRILALIAREARHARSGKPARIVAKMNALLEERVIGALAAASQAGVEIDLIVRGACALRPGVAGVSDRIRVRSVLGRFLEHHRVWYFENAGAPEVWLASADWMGRNLFRRIEVAFPVRDPELAKRVVAESLSIGLADNRDAWILDSDGAWRKPRRRKGAPVRSSQSELLAAMSVANQPPRGAAQRRDAQASGDPASVDGPSREGER